MRIQQHNPMHPGVFIKGSDSRDERAALGDTPMTNSAQELETIRHGGRLFNGERCHLWMCSG